MAATTYIWYDTDHVIWYDTDDVVWYDWTYTPIPYNLNVAVDTDKYGVAIETEQYSVAFSIEDE